MRILLTTLMFAGFFSTGDSAQAQSSCKVCS
jgi:hypothetical protein